jgi:AraC-like DNA-binding protein
MTVLICLAIGILLTVFLSRRAYEPIQELYSYGKAKLRLPTGEDPQDGLLSIRSCIDLLSRDVGLFHEYIDRTEPILQEHILYKILQGHYANEQLIRSECALYNIEPDIDSVVIAAEIENFYRGDRFQIRHLPLVTDALTIILGETIKKTPGVSGYSINYQQGTAIAVIHTENTDVSLIDEARTLSTGLSGFLKDHLDLQVSVGIGSIAHGVMELRESYQNALRALSQLSFHDGSHVFLLGDGSGEKKDEAPLFFYPNELEGAIISSFSTNELLKAEEYLKDFSQALKVSKSKTIIKQCWAMLLARLVESFRMDGGELSELLAQDLFGHLSLLRSDEEILDWFLGSLFASYGALSRNRRESNSSKLAQLIHRYVRDNITSDVSLVRCADYAGVTPSYVSRLFKHETGMSFLEFVINSKIEFVKNLLATTDDPVNSIAERVGYSERNLYRLFKRIMNISPTDYRNSHR